MRSQRTLPWLCSEPEPSIRPIPQPIGFTPQIIDTFDLAPHLQHLDSQFSECTLDETLSSEPLSGTTVAGCSSVAHDGRDNGYNPHDSELVWSLENAKKITSLPDQQGLATIAQFIDNAPGTTQEANDEVDSEDDMVAPPGYPKTNLYAPSSPIPYICYDTDNDTQAQSGDYDDDESSSDSDDGSDDFDFINSADNGALYTK